MGIENIRRLLKYDETSSKDKNIDKIPKENLREPDGEESNLLFTDEYKEALEKAS